MQRKNIILISITIVLFSVSGYVLYTGIFSKSTNVITEGTPNFESNKKNIIPILPYGDKLDFSTIDSRKDAEQPFQYEQLNPQTDVGVDIKNLIRNLVVNTPSGTPQKLTGTSDSSDSLLLYKGTQ